MSNEVIMNENLLPFWSRSLKADKRAWGWTEKQSSEGIGAGFEVLVPDVTQTEKATGGRGSANMGDGLRNMEKHTNKSHLCSVHQKWMQPWRTQHLYIFLFLQSLYLNFSHNITYIHWDMEISKYFLSCRFYQHFIIQCIYCHHWRVNEEN